MSHSVKGLSSIHTHTHTHNTIWKTSQGFSNLLRCFITVLLASVHSSRSRSWDKDGVASGSLSSSLGKPDDGLGKWHRAGKDANKQWAQHQAISVDKGDADPLGLLQGTLCSRIVLPHEQRSWSIAVPLIAMGDWSQEPLWLPKSWDARVP